MRTARRRVIIFMGSDGEVAELLDSCILSGSRMCGQAPDLGQLLADLLDDFSPRSRSS